MTKEAEPLLSLTYLVKRTEFQPSNTIIIWICVFPYSIYFNPPRVRVSGRLDNINKMDGKGAKGSVLDAFVMK